MKYKSIIVKEWGGPEKLTIVENDLREPGPGEARVRILAASVTQDDAAVRRGERPWLPKLPFAPGYSVVGVIDALGEGVDNLSAGERVVVLTSYGGYAEFLYWQAESLVRVPDHLDPAQVAPLILNYLVAYQVLHRYAKVKADDKALIIGASGGCGSAFLQLGQLAGLKMYGLASPSKHDLLIEYGATPIDYHTQDFVQVIRQAEPDGIDFVFNGMAEQYLRPGIAVLGRGGMMVHYGAPVTQSGFRKFLFWFILYNLLPNGKKIKGYGTHRLGVELFAEDWKILFTLLGEGKINPVIAAKFPILEAAKANELLESGQVTGNIVLLAPELL